MKKIYYCPNCKKDIKDWYTDPLIMLGRSIPSSLSGGGMVIKVCKKCNTALMEMVED